MKNFCALVFALAAHGAYAATSCEDMKNLKLADARVTRAESVVPAPEWKYPASAFDFFNVGPKGARKPFCRVALTIEKQIEVEVWLPQDWNGRFQGVGNGGLSGDFNYPALGVALAGGYATASTDTGHKTKNMFDTDWVVGNPQAAIDFGHRAHHLMAVTGKAVVAAHYGKPADRAYYSGCSSGGWQGLTEAQKYPGDYDGIVAGAPAINFTRLQMRPVMEERILAEPGTAITPDLNRKLVETAIAKCDSIDGVQDGLIDDPRKCDFDPASVPGITPAQARAAKGLYGPMTSRGGRKLYPGAAFGTELIIGLPGPTLGPAQPLIMTMFQQEKVLFTQASYDPDVHLPLLEKRFGEDMSAMQADLSAFAKRGGKLILYHGWSDPLLSPYNTLDYYDAVVKRMGSAQVGGFAKLFMAPGMAHCAGGPGPNTFDAVDAVVKWVEHGTAPAQLVATHVSPADGKPGRTRPLCPYPQVAKYSGSGSTDEAGNFRCSAP